MPSGTRKLPWLLLLLPALAAAQARPPARRGEAFTFSLRLGPIEGGRARLAISPPQPQGQHRDIRVLGEVEATGLAKVLTGVHDDYRLDIDAETLLPRQVQVAETGLRTRTVSVALSGGTLDLAVKKPDAEQRWQEHPPAEPRDPVASLLLMRAQPLHDGDRMEFIVLDGTILYRGEVEVAGREDLDTVLGPRRAIRLLCRGRRLQAGKSQTSAAREATLWLSDDAQRVPLRLEGETDLGRAYVELTSYQPPRRPLPPPRSLPGVVLSDPLADRAGREEATAQSAGP